MCNGHQFWRLSGKLEVECHNKTALKSLVLVLFVVFLRVLVENGSA